VPDYFYRRLPILAGPGLSPMIWPQNTMALAGPLNGWTTSLRANTFECGFW
jgi:hypothetical protein